MLSEIVSQECNECLKVLPMYEYGFSPSRGTHFPKCKDCTKARRKVWYKKDPNLGNHPWKKSRKKSVH